MSQRTDQDIHYHNTPRHTRIWLPVFVLALVALWWFGTSRVVPGPLEVWRAFADMIAPTHSNDFSYYAFSYGRSFSVHVMATALRLGLCLSIGTFLGFAFGIAAGIYAPVRQIIIVSFLFYLGGIPRLLEILYVNHLGIVGTPAATLLGSLSVMCCVGVATCKALQDQSLKDQVEHALLDTTPFRIALGVVLPQQRKQLSTGMQLGATYALGIIYFVEYVQGANGLGFLLQIAFGGDVHIPEAWAIAFTGMSLLGISYLMIALFEYVSPKLWSGALSLLIRRAS